MQISSLSHPQLHKAAFMNAHPQAFEDLQKINFLRSLPLEDLVDLSERCSYVRLVAEQKVFSQGAAGDALYFLIEGEVEISESTSNGTPRRIAILSSGVVFGETSLITGEPRTASAVCLTESRALRLSQDQFEDWISEGNPGASRFLRLLAVVLSKRLASTNERANQLAQLSESRSQSEQAKREQASLGADPFLSISPELQTKQRRAHRYPCSLRARLQGEEMWLPVLDVSRTGMRVSGMEKTSLHEIFLVELWEPLQKKHFWVRAQVQWFRDQLTLEAGFQFVEQSEAFRNWLNRHIERMIEAGTHSLPLSEP
jgi:CRP-like cAMP-binding protein